MVFTPKKWKVAVAVIVGVAFTVLVFLRAQYLYPIPSLSDGILFFKTQHNVSILLSSVVVIAWLPACMKVARVITTRADLSRFYPVFMSTYAVTVISAALFLQAQRRMVVITSFVIFAVTILLLLLSNLIVRNGINESKARSHHAAN